MTESEWGEWRTDFDEIKVGWYIYAEGTLEQNGERRGSEGVVTYVDDDSFDMSPRPDFDSCMLERYRIRKPKGLAILNAILREVERQPEAV